MGEEAGEVGEEVGEEQDKRGLQESSTIWWEAKTKAVRVERLAQPVSHPGPGYSVQCMVTP